MLVYGICLVLVLMLAVVLVVRKVVGSSACLCVSLPLFLGAKGACLGNGSGNVREYEIPFA